MADPVAVMALVVHHHRRWVSSGWSSGSLSFRRRRKRNGCRSRSASTSSPSARPGSSRPSHDGVGYLGLVAKSGDVGAVHLAGLPGLHGVSVYEPGCRITCKTRAACRWCESGFYTAIPFFIALGGEHRGQLGRRPAVERARSAQRKRRYLVALCLLLTAAGMADPVRPIADRDHRAGIDHGVVRQCRAGDQRLH